MEILLPKHLNKKVVRMKSGNPLLDLTFQFSLDIIQFVEMLHDNKKFVVSNQLVNQVPQ